MARDTKKPQIKATVFIPTYNGDKYLKDLIDAVFAQNFNERFEVLIIDSGSSDNTLSIISNYPDIRLHQIPNSEFGHGKTRNLAAQMANGEFVVYLSQDAVPAHNRWLEFMLEPFLINPKVQGVFGKQVPRPLADVTTKREISTVFNSLGPNHSIVINRKVSLITGEEFGPVLTFYSDVNSAARKDFLLNTLPYRDVPYSEDQIFGKDLLDNGYLKAYSPAGSVFHSNEYSLVNYFYRKYDENLGLYATIGILPPAHPLRHLKSAVVDTVRDITFAIRDREYSFKRKIYNILICWYRNFAKEYATYLVARDEHRNKIGHKFSLEKKHTHQKKP